MVLCPRPLNQPRWMERPQSLPVRKFLFQIHLWTGIVAGLYVIVISLTGSAIVLRREIETRLQKHIVVSSAGRARLGRDKSSNARD